MDYSSDAPVGINICIYITIYIYIKSLRHFFLVPLRSRFIKKEETQFVSD